MRTCTFSINDVQYDKAIEIMTLQSQIPFPDYKITDDIFVDFSESLTKFLDKKLRETRKQIYSK